MGNHMKDRLDLLVEVNIYALRRSGGGTQASYITALEDRIAASAPENYITSLNYLMAGLNHTGI